MSYNSENEGEKIDEKYFDLIKDLTIAIGTIFGSSIALAVGKSLNFWFILGECFLFLALCAGIINLYSNLRGKESYHFMRTIYQLKENMPKKIGTNDFVFKAHEDVLKNYKKLYIANQNDPLRFLLNLVKVDYFYPILLITFLLGVFLILLSLINPSIPIYFFYNCFLNLSAVIFKK